MAIEIVDFPMKNGGSFHSYVNLPEGMSENKATAFRHVFHGCPWMSPPFHANLSFGPLDEFAKKVTDSNTPLICVIWAHQTPLSLGCPLMVAPGQWLRSYASRCRSTEPRVRVLRVDPWPSTEATTIVRNRKTLKWEYRFPNIHHMMSRVARFVPKSLLIVL